MMERYRKHTKNKAKVHDLKIDAPEVRVMDIQTQATTRWVCLKIVYPCVPHIPTDYHHVLR